MPIDVGLLTITGAIFHPVPMRNSFDDAGNLELPVLSTKESRLDSRLEFFLRDRLTGTFAAAAQPIARDEHQITPTPDLVHAALASGVPDIVEAFHPLPALLLSVQAHNSPKGLLSVVRGKCGSTPVLILVKVEQERGMSFETYKEDEQIRVEVVIQDGLVFTDKTEVFKAALFYLEDGELAGLLTDDQTGSMYHGPSSLYWLSDFLGCRYTRASDVNTRSWIKATERLIKSDLTDPAQKDSVYTAMVAELGSNRNVINPRKFIEDYVPFDAQDDARQRLLNEGAPTAQFTKSRDVSSNAPPKKRISFDGGIEVTMPVDATPDLSHEDVDGRLIDVLTIKGRIRRVGA